MQEACADVEHGALGLNMELSYVGIPPILVSLRSIPFDLRLNYWTVPRLMPFTSHLLFCLMMFFVFYGCCELIINRFLVIEQFAARSLQPRLFVIELVVSLTHQAWLLQRIRHPHIVRRTGCYLPRSGGIPRKCCGIQLHDRCQTHRS